MNERTPARLIAVAVLALLLFTYPLLALFDRPVRVLGLPLIWVYLFGAWAGVVLLVQRILRD